MKILQEIDHMNILRRFTALTIALYCSCISMMGQTLKMAEVKQGEPYVDHISLDSENKGHDLLVKFIFDEPTNTLKVCLISYKKLFVFQSDVSYRTASRCHKMKAEYLPYVVTSDEQARYRFTKALRKSIKPKRKHIFNRWISVDGLQPQPQDFRMVNDYIEQTYDIVGQSEKVTVVLRDVLLMEEEITSKKKNYELYFQKDLNREYNVTIQRNPCLGKEQQIQESATRLEAIRTSFHALRDKFGSNAILSTPESLDLFNEMKKVIQSQFPRNEEKVACPDIQQNIDEYNAIVDSVNQIRCEYLPEEEIQIVKLEFPAEYILSMARKIDLNVSRWLLSNDPIEKRDMIKLNEEIIRLMSAPIDEATEMEEDQASAVKVFRNAAAYFQKVCLKK